MFDPAATALLRAVFEEVCEDVPRLQAVAHTHVASKLLEATSKGETAPESLAQVGREALHDAPTMWR
jgi:hypothetical protein|nr:hypothetical protein [Bradyrhizobium sp. I71]